MFPEAAHNPASNQSDRRRYQPTNQSTRSKRSDAISYRSLQNPLNNHHEYGRLGVKCNFRQEQRSADNLLYSLPQDLIQQQQQSTKQHNSIDIYSEPIIDDSTHRPRAQPQVPIYRKMGRRASEGNTLSDKDAYADVTSVKREKSEMVVGNTKDVSKTPYLADSANQMSNSGLEMPVLSYPSAGGCRLSLDGGRRQSSASLSSSMADGSKDSLSSYDSSSTLTGHDTDEQIYMNKLRKSVQRKEEFLSNNNNNNNNNNDCNPDSALIQKVYYGRASKLTNAVWPPIDQPLRSESPSRNTKPTHQNFQRVKNDIDNERDYNTFTPQNDTQINMKQQSREWNNYNSKIQEASPAPLVLDNAVLINGANENYYGTSLQMVHKRAKQFESGKPMIEDDPLINDRTSFYKSELSRISEKKVVPNVPDRAREFEMISELQRDSSAGSTSASQLRRNQRDTRSLESTGKYDNNNNNNIQLIIEIISKI